jgi:hypothetical protein
LDFGNIFITVGPGWLGDNTNLSAEQVWNFAEEGKWSISIFLSRTVSKDGALSGSLWKTTASLSPSAREATRCPHT